MYSLMWASSSGLIDSSRSYSSKKVNVEYDGEEPRAKKKLIVKFRSLDEADGEIFSYPIRKNKNHATTILKPSVLWPTRQR